MLNSVARAFTFLQARWRWVRGRCPLCTRKLYATFPYYMADYPNCPVCKDETQTDLRLWQKYAALGTAKRLDVAGVPR